MQPKESFVIPAVLSLAALLLLAPARLHAAEASCASSDGEKTTPAGRDLLGMARLSPPYGSGRRLSHWTDHPPMLIFDRNRHQRDVHARIKPVCGLARDDGDDRDDLARLY